MGLHLYFCTSVSVQTKRLASSSTQLISVNNASVLASGSDTFLCSYVRLQRYVRTCLYQRSIVLMNIFGFCFFLCAPIMEDFFFWLLVLLRLFWCAHGPVQYHMETVIVVIDLASLRCLGIAPYCHMTGLLLVLEIILLLVPGYLYPVPLCGGDVSACRAGSCHI